MPRLNQLPAVHPLILSLLLSLVLAISSVVAGADASAVGEGAENEKGKPGGKLRAPTRILFVGNSYLYYNDSLHNHVKRMLAELRPELAESLEYKSATIGGARLKHHNIEWLLKPGQIGVGEPFEVVIMQGGSSEVLSERSRTAFYDTATRYADKARQIGARPYLYMTHAYVAPHRRARDNMIDEIAAAYTEAGRRAKATVIPVGLAFAESYRRRPDYALHMHFDGTHPNLRGTYLAALVVLQSVYGDAVDTLSYSYFDELSAADIDYLQAVASEVARVSSSPY
jgi:hypothetical protein